MELIKMILRAITIIIGIALYIGVWLSMIKNWDKCVRTGYNYPCFEAFLGEFYFIWMLLHFLAIVCTFVWAWVY